ncbi:hypothetical protein Q7P37_005676 [Cladosporium fusiforme]
MADQVKYNKLHGKKILIVGGSSGLGYAVAEASLESGATVIISSSNPDRVATAVSRLQTAYPSAKARITGHACDLSQETTLESNLTALLNKTTSYGSAPLDHAIHTAGDALALVKLADVDFPAIKKAGMLRFFAPMLLAKHLPAHIHPGPGEQFHPHDGRRVRTALARLDGRRQLRDGRAGFGAAVGAGSEAFEGECCQFGAGGYGALGWYERAGEEGDDGEF